MSENQQALNHVVSMEDLTVDQVMKLIKRGIEFKNGDSKALMKTTRLFPIFFFEDSTRRISPLKCQRLNWG